MDQQELKLLETYAATDPELKSLWEDHVLYEKQVEKLEHKAFGRLLKSRRSNN